MSTAIIKLEVIRTDRLDVRVSSVGQLDTDNFTVLVLDSVGREDNLGHRIGEKVDRVQAEERSGRQRGGFVQWASRWGFHTTLASAVTYTFSH